MYQHHTHCPVCDHKAYHHAGLGGCDMLLDRSVMPHVYCSCLRIWAEQRWYAPVETFSALHDDDTTPEEVAAFEKAMQELKASMGRGEWTS